MSLQAFYFDVTITGRALVYAESQTAARLMLDDTGVTIAGNALRDPSVTVVGPVESCPRPPHRVDSVQHDRCGT